MVSKSRNEQRPVTECELPFMECGRAKSYGSRSITKLKAGRCERKRCYIRMLVGGGWMVSASKRNGQGCHESRFYMTIKTCGVCSIHVIRVPKDSLRIRKTSVTKR